MTLLPRDRRMLQDTLASFLDGRSDRYRQVRVCQRCCEPELAYGRHHGTPPANARQAAVIALLYPSAKNAPGDAQWTVALTRRSSALLDHPGQISFPGGMVEPGETTTEAALREWEEEMGCPSAEFHIVGELNPTYVFVSNFRVTPVVAIADTPPAFCPNPDEVARVIELPAESLMAAAKPHGDGWGSHWVRRSELEFKAPHLDWEGEKIWGATLQMLVELGVYLRGIGRL